MKLPGQVKGELVAGGGCEASGHTGAGEGAHLQCSAVYSFLNIVPETTQMKGLVLDCRNCRHCSASPACSAVTVAASSSRQQQPCTGNCTNTNTIVCLY